MMGGGGESGDGKTLNFFLQIRGSQKGSTGILEKRLIFQGSCIQHNNVVL